MAIKKILIVDDSPTDRQFLSDMLAKNGFKVSTAESAEDAMNKVKQSRPDLVLMDIVLPGQNGFQATRTLTRDEAKKTIPVILCTVRRQWSRQSLQRLRSFGVRRHEARRHLGAGAASARRGALPRGRGAAGRTLARLAQCREPQAALERERPVLGAGAIHRFRW